MSPHIGHARTVARTVARTFARTNARDAARSCVRLAVAVWMSTGAVAACASGSASRGVTAGGRTDVLYRNEIAKSTAQNAYDAVRLLRPSFLSGRGPTTLLRPRASSVAPVVYLDNQRLGDARTLENIPVEGIVEIRFVGASQAQLRWGMDHPAGAIQVVTGTVRSP